MLGDFSSQGLYGLIQLFGSNVRISILSLVIPSLMMNTSVKVYQVRPASPFIPNHTCRNVAIISDNFYTSWLRKYTSIFFSRGHANPPRVRESFAIISSTERVRADVGLILYVATSLNSEGSLWALSTFHCIHPWEHVPFQLMTELYSKIPHKNTMSSKSDVFGCYFSECQVPLNPCQIMFVLPFKTTPLDIDFPP